MQLTSIRHLMLALPVQEALGQELVGAGPVLGAVVQRDGAEQDGGVLGQAIASYGGVSVQYSAGRKGFVCGKESGMREGRRWGRGGCHAGNQ